MSCPWICLSLLYAATFLQSSKAANKGVSLECNNTTVEVKAGENVTLKCNIHYSGLDSDCKCLRYICLNTHDNMLCDSSCEWDNVLPTIPNVTKEDNYTVRIQTDCGEADSSIKVQVKKPYATTPSRNSEQPSKPDVTPSVRAIWAIFVILIVLDVWIWYLYKALGAYSIDSTVQRQLCVEGFDDIKLILARTL